LTELLLEKEVIEGDELRAVLMPAMVTAGLAPNAMAAEPPTA
jgi:hypothetical protein